MINKNVNHAGDEFYVCTTKYTVLQLLNYGCIFTIFLHLSTVVQIRFSREDDDDRETDVFRAQTLCCVNVGWDGCCNFGDR